MMLLMIKSFDMITKDQKNGKPTINSANGI